MEFKSLSEAIVALKQYELKGILDPRLSNVEGGITYKAASGQNEIVAADGGYLIGGEIIAPLQHALMQKSSLFSKASKFYSSSKRVNEGLIPFVNESARTASAFQMKSYWVEEAGTKTDAKYTIGLASCKLNKVYAVMYITDELFADDAGFKSSVDKFIADDKEGSLVWAIDRAILMGDGATSMYGIMSANTNGTVGVAQADALNEATLKAFNAALTPASQKNAEWYISQENYIELQAITFANDGDKYYKDGDLYVYGKKVNVLEQMVAPYDLMLGDVSQYGIALKTGPLVQSAISVHVKFLTDEKTIRWGIRINGKSFGSTYTLESGEEVGTFVVPEDVPAEESSSSSSSSSVDSHSSSSSSKSESSSSSSENYSDSSSSSSESQIP
jgi:HK97 family phage major capsid protein